MSALHNAVWSSKTAQAEIKVWADGGCIWPSNPTQAPQPDGSLMDLIEQPVEVATYEATDYDESTGLESAWQVIVEGKIDGTLRFA